MKLVHLVGFIIKDFVTMHGNMNVNNFIHPFIVRPKQRWQVDVMEDLKLKIKTGRKQLRTKELGETWLRRRKPTNDDDDDEQFIVSTNK